MPSSRSEPPALQLSSWLEELWNASSSNATVGQAALISFALAVLAAVTAHLLTKRREGGRWAKQNTLHALQRATEAFYAARQHYGHLLRVDPDGLMLGIRDDSAPYLNTPRDWTPLQEGLQRAHEALIDVQLSSGRYRKRVLSLSKLAHRMVEKLDEIAYTTSFTTPQGQPGQRATMKKEWQYYEDAMNAIHDYETAFLQFREDITADLTARWWIRIRHKSGRWRARREQNRHAKAEGASSDNLQSADASEEP